MKNLISATSLTGYFKQIDKFIKSSRKKDEFFVNDNFESTEYLFVYKQAGSKELYYENMELSSRVDNDKINGKIAVDYYKEILVNFNNTLKPGEKKRTFVKCYKIESAIKLTKIENDEQ